MKTILLSQGKFAIVDDEDYEKLSKYKWCANNRHGCWYAVRTSNKKIIRMHRQILGLKKGDGMKTDHVNHNGLDNRRCNLRICTLAENNHNRQRNKKWRSSKFKGVSWDKKMEKWRTQICYNYKLTYIGCLVKVKN